MFKKPKSFSLKSMPHRHRSLLYKIRFNSHKQKVIMSIAGLYVLVAGLVGYGLFYGTNDQSSAFYPAEMAAALKLQANESLVVGEEVKFDLTLQNASPNEAINNVELSLLSTRESIDWQTLRNNEQGNVFDLENNQAQVLSLSAGERATYTIGGTILNKNLDAISVLGKISYNTPSGIKFTDTNREFIPLSDRVNPTISQYLNLGSDAQSYEEDQVVSLTLSKNGVAKENIEGTVYVSNQDTKEVVAGENCNLNETENCTINVLNLTPGSYSALFVNDEETLYSQISQFNVLGSTTNFTPADDTRLVTPFGPGSINGITYIYALDVLNSNTIVDTSQVCEFLISRNGQEVTGLFAQVNENKDCVLKLNSAQVEEEGVYNVRLNNTSKNIDISVVKKTPGLLNLENNTLVLSNERDVELSIENITDQYNTELSDIEATLHVLNDTSGEYQEIKVIDAQRITVVDGVLEMSVPGNVFRGGGIYHTYVTLEDGKQSDTLVLDFLDDEIGHTSTGVLIENYDSLRIGEAIELTVGGVKDRNGTSIQSGDCGVEIYTTSDNTTPLFVNGEIQNGNCDVIVDEDIITSTGPALVTLSGRQINSDIPQSRQIFIKPGAVDNYGFLNLEYEPARVGYANNLIIGPVTDIFGNLTDQDGLTLAVINSDQVVYQVEDIAISEGFAQVVIPSSIFSGVEGDQVFFNIINQETGDTVLSKTITMIEEKTRLILPYIETELNSDENISVEFGGLESIEEFPCSMQYIRSDIDYSFASSTYSLATDSCEFDYDLKEYRDNKYGLIKLDIGDKQFHKVVTNNSGEPVNLFTLEPEIKIDSRDEVQIRLHTSPIVDQQGLPVQEGTVKLEYNGKLIEAPIKNGLVTFDMPAKLFDSKDIKDISGDKYLELAINAKASILSISQTNELEIFLNDKDIADEHDNAKLVKGSNVVNASDIALFAFDTETCNAVVSSVIEGSRRALTHFQDDTCYVQSNNNVSNYSITFEDNGFRMAQFNYKAVDYTVPQIDWCTESPCKIRVNGGLSSPIAVTLFDGVEEYRFTSEDLSNELLLEQNGLNPLKDYKVQVEFEDEEGNTNTVVNDILGELLIN